MVDPTPDPILATDEEAIAGTATGQISPNNDGTQILNSAGKDIVPDRNWKVAWMAHPELDLEIVFDERGILEETDRKKVKKRFVIRAGDVRTFVVKSRAAHASYFYDAKLLANNRRRRRCLSGEQASPEEEKNFVETYTATRPRIVVGTGGDHLTDDGESPCDM